MGERRKISRRSAVGAIAGAAATTVLAGPAIGPAEVDQDGQGEGS